MEDVYEKNIKKFFAMFVSFSLLNIITIFSTVQAVDISSANIVSGGECGNLLKYKGNVVKKQNRESHGG